MHSEKTQKTTEQRFLNCTVPNFIDIDVKEICFKKDDHLANVTINLLKETFSEDNISTN